MNVQELIKQQVEQNDIILYMKGTPQQPQCGFSSRVINILKSCNAKFATVNVLDDPDIRQGIKEFSKWPTIPQLYIKGQFIGGSDIVSEMYDSGELQNMLKETIT